MFHIIIQMKNLQIITAHKILDRNTLVNQPCSSKGIMWCLNNHDISLLCHLLDRLGNIGSLADDQTACIHLDRAQLRLITVSKNDKIILLNKILHQIRTGCGNDNFSIQEIAMLIPGDQCSVQCFDDIAVLGSRCCKDIIIVHFHI